MLRCHGFCSSLYVFKENTYKIFEFSPLKTCRLAIKVTNFLSHMLN